MLFGAGIGKFTWIAKFSPPGLYHDGLNEDSIGMKPNVHNRFKMTATILSSTLGPRLQMMRLRFTRGE